MRCHEEEEEDEERAEDSAAVDVSASDLRAKWFLSTSQWQGFIPLQIPGIDSLCSEEMLDHDSQPACTEDTTESGQMSSAVSESLAKMKENHSLFYKIACDISISDTDITNNDGNVNAHASSVPEEEERCSVAESGPDEEAGSAGRSSNQDSEESSLVLKKPRDSDSAGKETHVYEEIPQNDGEATSGQESQSHVKGTNREASAPGAEYDQARQGEDKTTTERSEDRKVDKEWKKSRSLSEENKKEAVEEGAEDKPIALPSSAYRGGSVSRSSSFGKARLTVLRTSL